MFFRKCLRSFFRVLELLLRKRFDVSVYLRVYVVMFSHELLARRRELRL